MKLEIIVEGTYGNYMLYASIILTLGISAITVLYFHRRSDKQKLIVEKIEKDEYRKYNFPAFLKGPIRYFAKRRLWITLILLADLAIFYIIIIDGFVGIQTGNQSLSIVFVWILWWFALITILVPFFGRAWCTVCPLPSMGEWMQRKSIIERKPAKSGKFGLNKKWPKRLRNLWLVNFGFLGMALFSPFLTTHPFVTGVLLGGLIIVPIILSIIYEKRAFCRYVCPVGGFLGLYSNFSCFELRVDSREVCKKHKTKECIKGRDKGFGTEGGYACPFMVFPQNLKRNAFCGLCFECMKSCPRDNINVKFRGFGTDLVREDKEKDTSEAWKGHIMLNLAAMYSIVLLGPYPFLREWATFEHGIQVWLFYLFIFLGTTLLFVPFAFLLFVALSRWLSKRKDITLKKLFIDYSMATVPFGLMAWIAFSFVLILVQWSYIPSVVSDPFGWGWDLFGMKDIKWNPIFPESLPYIQMILLSIGLVFSISTTYKVSIKHFKEKKIATRATIPIVVFFILAMIVYLRLFVG
jgi:ferredoxin